jgi:hypothetical protein
MSGTVRVVSEENRIRAEAQDRVKSERAYLGQVSPNTPEATRFSEAINRLDRASLQKGDQSWMMGGGFTAQQKQEITNATQAVTDSRKALEQARASAPDRIAPPSTQGLIQNEGEKGVYRDPGTGEVVKRDPGAKTAIEQAMLKGNYGKLQRYDQGPSKQQVADGQRIMTEGMKGPLVQEMQAALRKQGFDPGKKKDDIFWGPKMQKAVEGWMAKNNLQGTFDNTALQKLLGS